MSKGKKGNASEPARFEGDGVSFRAKLIGVEDVPEARGDQMCQGALAKLKNIARLAGVHKRKIQINVTLEGVRITDAISLEVLHIHPVPRISFISRDPTDTRAFGYIYETDDRRHTFFAIKTAGVAEQVVLALKDLFQAVFEIKKKELGATQDKPEELKTQDTEQAQNTQIANGNDNTGTDREAIPIEIGQPEAAGPLKGTTDNQLNTGAEKVEVRPAANLFDFDDQPVPGGKITEKNNSLELEFLANTPPASQTPTSPGVKVTSPTTESAGSFTDPWGLSSVTAPTSASQQPSSAIDDLAGLQTGFITNFSTLAGLGQTSSFNSPASFAGSKDPFSGDSFGSFQAQPTPFQQLSVPLASGIGGPPNPFTPDFRKPFDGNAATPTLRSVSPYGFFPGVVPHGAIPPSFGNTPNPFAYKQSKGPELGNPFEGLALSASPPEPTQEVAGWDAAKAKAKPAQTDLFSDLVAIKKTAPAGAKTPKEAFTQASSTEKKSINELIGSGGRASPLPTLAMKPGVSPRASPVPAIVINPAASPRDSPVPPTVLRPPPASPRDSPVPTILVPSVSPRASPVPPPMLTPTTPRDSPVPMLKTSQSQDSLFDDIFGTAQPQNSSSADVFGAPAQQTLGFDDVFGTPVQKVEEKSLFD